VREVRAGPPKQDTVSRIYTEGAVGTPGPISGKRTPMSHNCSSSNYSFYVLTFCRNSFSDRSWQPQV